MKGKKGFTLLEILIVVRQLFSTRGFNSRLTVFRPGANVPVGSFLFPSSPQAGPEYLLEFST